MVGNSQDTLDVALVPYAHLNVCFAAET
jgi:hypothetical protein